MSGRRAGPIWVEEQVDGILDGELLREVDRLSTVAALHERSQVAGRYGMLTGEGMAPTEGGT